MAVLQMQKISICALKKDRKAVLEKLQRMKVMEISQILEEDPDFTTMDTRQERMELEKSASLSDQALEILDRYAPEKKSMFSALEGKALIEADDYEKVVDQKEQLLCTVKRILALDKEKAEQKVGILKLENSMESLTPWMDLHVPMNYGHHCMCRTAIIQYGKSDSVDGSSCTDELWRYDTYSDADRNHAACHAGRDLSDARTGCTGSGWCGCVRYLFG